MTDAREALVARQREEYGESWDVLVPEVGWALGRIIESVIEDVLGAGWTPPTVKPTLEQVVDALAAQRPGSAEWTSNRVMQTARAVLALLPGRTEAEVIERVLDALRPEHSDLIPIVRARIEKEADRG